MSYGSSFDYDIFISYASDYRREIRKLYDKLTYDHNYKCWLDDIEANTIESVDDYEAKPDRPKLNLNVLAEGINNSKVFLCCISKEYHQNQQNIDEINHARNVGKPLVILMMDRLKIKELGGVGFIIGPLIRINAYNFENHDFFEEPSNSLISQIIKSIEEKLKPTKPNPEQTDKQTFYVRTLATHKHPILCMIELSDQKIACGCSDGTIILANLNDLENKNIQIVKLEGHINSVVCLKELPKNRIASASMDSNIIVWNTIIHVPISILSGHTEGVVCLKVLPNGCLCSGSTDFSIRVWSAKSFECIKEIRGPVKLHIRLFKNAKYYARNAFSEYKLKFNTIGSESILDYDSKENIPMIEITKDKAKSKETLERSEISSFEIDEENQELTKTQSNSSNKETNKIFDESSLEKESLFKINKQDGHTNVVICLKNIKATFKDNEKRRRFASGSYDSLIKIWDASNYECIATLKGHTDRVICLKNLPKNRLASGSEDSTIRIWEMDNYTCIKTLTGHNSYVQSLALLPGNKLVSGSYDSKCKLWDLGSGKFECIKVFKDHSEPVNIVKRFDNDCFISSCNERLIKVWNIKANKYECIQTFRDHNNWISSILPLKSQPGRVCSCSWDCSVKIWTPLS